MKTEIISLGAFLMSMISLGFAVFSWRESHRPIIVVRLNTESGGNIAIPVEIVVENCGNRPAKNIRLTVDKSELSNALKADSPAPLKKAIERCFDAETFIPLLEPSREVSNSFGVFSNDKNSTWVYKSILNIYVHYQGLNGRRFSNSNPIRLVDNTGFALTFFQSRDGK